MTCQSVRVAFVCGLVFVIGLTACQDGVVDVSDPEAPEQQTAEQLLQRMEDSGGLIVLEPDEYDLFGYAPPNRDAQAQSGTNGVEAKSSCSNPDVFTTSDFSTSRTVCVQTANITIDNVPFKRVSIDASISTTRLFKLHPIEDNPPMPTVSIASTTYRNGTTLLQDEFASTSASSSDVVISTATDFVAAYPAVDTFTFNHTSDFGGAGMTYSNDTETKSVTF